MVNGVTPLKIIQNCLIELTCSTQHMMNTITIITQGDELRKKPFCWNAKFLLIFTLLHTHLNILYIKTFPHAISELKILLLIGKKLINIVSVVTALQKYIET